MRSGKETSRSRPRRALVLACALGLALCAAGAPVSAQEGAQSSIGRTATPQEIAAWDIDIAPDGRGLPPGSGTVALGRTLYGQKCAFCHGAVGNETRAHSLIVPRLRNLWCCATSVYDYTFRAMPFYGAQSLKPEEVYSLVAFVLFQNKLVPENFVADAKSLPRVTMPRASSYAINPWTKPPPLNPLLQPGNPWSSDKP